MIEEADEQGMDYGMMIGQFISPDDLGVLVNAVRGHYSGIFMQIIGKPEQYTGTEGGIGQP